MVKNDSNNYLLNMLGLHIESATSDGNYIYDIYKGDKNVGHVSKGNKGLVYNFETDPNTFAEITESAKNCYDGFIGVKRPNRSIHIDYIYVGSQSIFNFQSASGDKMFELSDDGIFAKDGRNTAFLKTEDIFNDREYSIRELTIARNAITYFKSLVPTFIQSPETQHKDAFDKIFPNKEVRKKQHLN